VNALLLLLNADIELCDYAGHKPFFYLAQSASTGRINADDCMQSKGYLRSAALLKSRRRPNSSMLLQQQLSTTSNVIQRYQSSRRASMPAAAAMDDGASTRRTPMRMDRALVQATSPFLLPPREMPAVVKRRPVSSSRESTREATAVSMKTQGESAGNESHSDPESTTTRMKASGSAPDFGTLV